MANKTNNYQIAGETDLTTTGNIDDLDVKGYSLIRMNNASDATIRGIRAGYAGQIITFVSIGAGNVFFAHQNAGSSAANRLINYVTSGNTPLAAGVGTATYQYDSTTLRWRLVQHNQGAMITVAYAAGNYTASGSMTWTVDAGDQTTYTYLVYGRILMIELALDTTALGGTANQYLRVLIPNSYTMTKTSFIPYFNINTGTRVVAEAIIQAAETRIFFAHDLARGNWDITTAVGVYASLRFPID